MFPQRPSQAFHLKDQNVAISIGGYSVIVKKINVQTMSEEELQGTIQFEAEQYIPFDIQDVYIDFQDLKTNKDGYERTDVMLVAAKKEIVAHDTVKPKLERHAESNHLVTDVKGAVLSVLGEEYVRIVPTHATERNQEARVTNDIVDDDDQHENRHRRKCVKGVTGTA